MTAELSVSSCVTSAKGFSW